MIILSLGQKIKKRRKELNMTLKDLAGDRITPGQISLVESGKSNPSMDLLEYLANNLDTSIEYLMESEEAQAENICLYYEDISEFYIMNEDFIQGEKYIENALYYAEKYSLDYRKAKSLYLRSIIYISKSEMATAQQLLMEANLIFIKHNYYEDVINTFLKLGNITLNLKAYNLAFSYFQQAEKVFLDNNVGSDFLLGQIYFSIALTYFKLEELDKAINYSYLAKEKFTQIDNKKQYAKSLLLMAEEYNLKGDIESAVKYAKRASKVFKDANDLDNLADIENDLGKLFFEFENLEESFIHLNKAKEIREKHKDGRLIDTLNNICQNHIKLKDIEKSKETLEEIKQLMDSGDENTLVSYYMLKYKVDILEKKFDEAQNTLICALDYTKSIKDFKKAAEISIIIGKFYLDNGDEKEAASYLNEGVEMYKKQGILK